MRTPSCNYGLSKYCHSQSLPRGLRAPAGTGCCGGPGSLHWAGRRRPARDCASGRCLAMLRRAGTGGRARAGRRADRRATTRDRRRHAKETGRGREKTVLENNSDVRPSRRSVVGVDPLRLRPSPAPRREHAASRPRRPPGETGCLPFKAARSALPAGGPAPWQTCPGASPQLASRPARALPKPCCHVCAGQSQPLGPGPAFLRPRCPKAAQLRLPLENLRSQTTPGPHKTTRAAWHQVPPCPWHSSGHRGPQLESPAR